MARQVLTRADTEPAPYDVDLGALDVLTPDAIFAHYNGAAAGGSFLPCVTYYTQDGKVFARAFPASSVAAGGSADVSFFPGLSQSPDAASSGSLEVTDGTVTVTPVTEISTTGLVVSSPGGGVAGLKGSWVPIGRVKSDSGGAAVSQLVLSAIPQTYTHLLAVGRFAYDDSGASVTYAPLKVTTNYTGGLDWQSFTDYVQDGAGVASSPCIVKNLVFPHVTGGIGEAYGFACFFFPYYAERLSYPPVDNDAFQVPMFSWEGAVHDLDDTVGMHMITGACSGGNGGTGFDLNVNKITFDISPSLFTFSTGPSIVTLYGCM